MAIQTEVTLQSDYTCCLRVMGKKSRIAEIVICQRTRWSLSSTLVNTRCVNFLSSLLIIIQASESGFLDPLFGLLVPIRLIVRDVLAVARSKFRQRQFFFNTVYRRCFITITNAFFNILINHYRVCE